MTFNADSSAHRSGLSKPSRQSKTPECMVKKPVTTRHSTTVTTGTFVSIPVAVESAKALRKALGAILAAPFTDSASIRPIDSFPLVTLEAASVPMRWTDSLGSKPLPLLSLMVPLKSDLHEDGTSTPRNRNSVHARYRCDLCVREWSRMELLRQDRVRRVVVLWAIRKYPRRDGP